MLKFCAGFGALAALVLSVFWAGLAGGFIFDDYPNLVDDTSWRLQQWSFTGLWQVLAGGIASATGRPFAMLSFALNHLFGAADAWGLKLGNVLLHALNACLAALLLRQLMVLSRESARIGLWWAAVIAAAVWTLHPLQVSSVLYVVQRMEVGAVTGVLLGLLAYLRARDAMCAGRRFWPWCLLVVASGLFGLGFKETAVLLPLYALWLEILLLHFKGRAGKPIGWLYGLYAAGTLLAVVVYCFWMLPQYAGVERFAGRNFGAAERLLSQGPVLVMYLQQALTAWPELLRFYYDNYPISSGLLSPSITLWSWLGLLGLALSAALLRRCLPLYSLGIAWFFSAHVLTSNIFPLELAFEHRNYFALLGLVLSALGLALAAGRRLTVGAGPALALVLLAYVGMMGWVQVATWADPGRLALTLSNRAPDSERATYAVGRHFYGLSGGDEENPLWSMARAEFVRAAALPQSSPLAEQAVLIMDAKAGRADDVAMWDSLSTKLHQREMDAQMLGAVEGVVQCRTSGACRFSDDSRLQQVLLVALQKNPDSSRLHARYAEFAFSVMGDDALARNLLHEAIRLDPGQPVFHLLLARILIAADDASEELVGQELNAALQSAQQLDVHGEHAEEILRLRSAAFSN